MVTVQSVDTVIFIEGFESVKVIFMFEIQSGARTKFKYEVQGLFTKERINQSLNIETSWP